MDSVTLSTTQASFRLFGSVKSFIGEEGLRWRKSENGVILRVKVFFVNFVNCLHSVRDVGMDFCSSLNLGEPNFVFSFNLFNLAEFFFQFLQLREVNQIYQLTTFDKPCALLMTKMYNDDQNVYW